jgi:poly(beta-D-mannuronate) lyase
LPAPPPGVMIIPHHYLTGSNGPINPEEAAATAPYRRLDDVVTFGAGRYVADGDPAQAVCVANLLSKWAAARALLDYTFQESSQAWYQVEWTLSSISLAWSVVRNDPAISPAQRAQIEQWMHAVTEYMLSQDPHPGERENNHAYWRALCATSVGILTSDNELYRRGLAQYARAIGQMNPDGSLPFEMARHENALHYQSFALAPLVMIAELARRQGVDLYSLRVNGHSIDDAVDFLVRASSDPTLVKKYASEPQTFSLFSAEKPPAWLEFWAARHPGKIWTELLTTPLVDPNIGGDTTLYAAPAVSK